MEEQRVQVAELLDVAFRTERWIDKFGSDTVHGRVWGLAAERPDKYIHTLYAGSAGIVLFYLELCRATGEQKYLDTACAAGDELLAQIPGLRQPTCSPMGG